LSFHVLTVCMGYFAVLAIGALAIWMGTRLRLDVDTWDLERPVSQSLVLARRLLVIAYQLLRSQTDFDVGRLKVCCCRRRNCRGWTRCRRPVSPFWFAG